MINKLPIQFLLLMTIPIVVFFGTIAQTEAATFFEGVNECKSASGVVCPYGSKKQSEGRTSQDFTCMPNTSLFCTLLTGSPLIAHDSNNRQYCVGDTLPSTAVCSKSNGKLSNNVPGVGFGVDSWKLDLKIGISTNAQAVDKKLRDLFGTDSYYRGVSGVAVLGGGPEKNQLGCIELEIDGNDELRVWVPRMEDRFAPDGGRVEEYDSATRNLKRMLDSINFGIVINRDDGDPLYCESTDQVYIRPEGADSDDGFCYSGVGQRPCMIKQVRGLGDLCVTGIDPAADEPIYRQFDDSNDSFSKFVRTSSNPNLCKLNSKDLLENSTNKGCSDYAVIDPATNEVDYLDKDKYNECAACIYGSSTFNSDNSKVDPVTLADGTEVVAPAGAIITPDNEYFGKPLQGHFYSDLGCINTAETNSIINTVVRFALVLMGILVIFRIIQGTLLMQQVSGADPEAVQEGKTIIVTALIALLLLIFSVAMLNFLGINVLRLGDQGFEPL